MLRPEWFEPKLLRRESERDHESRRDKRLFHHIQIFVDPAARYQKNQTWDWMEFHTRLRQCSGMTPERRMSERLAMRGRAGLAVGGPAL